MKSKYQCKQNGKERLTIQKQKIHFNIFQRENAVIGMTVIFTVLSIFTVVGIFCNFLVCRSAGSKGRGFFRVKVTSIKDICNIRHLVPHSSLSSSNSLLQTCRCILESRASTLQNSAYTSNKLRHHIHLIDVISGVWFFSFIASSQKWKHTISQPWVGYL